MRAWLVLPAVLLLWSPAAFADFAAGSCVLANGTPAVILGPSNIPGQYMARDSRLNAGAGQSFRAEQLQEVPCPGAAMAQNECFATDEGPSGSDLEQVVRHALVTSLQRSETETNVVIDRVAVGQPRAWTPGDEIQYGIADMTKAMVDVRALYRTCIDQVTDIYQTRQENNFVCYSAAADGEIVCEITGSTGDLEKPTSQSLPKF